MGRVAGLMHHAVAIRGASAAGAAARRLDRAAAQAAPLAAADRCLAPLTCARLESLLAAATGDEALAAALDRYAQQAEDGAQRMERPPLPSRRAAAGRDLRPPRPLPAAARVAGARGRRAPARRGPEPWGAAARPRKPHATAAAVPTRPAPSRPSSPREIRGLEWLPLPASAAAAATSVLDVAAPSPAAGTPAHAAHERRRTFASSSRVTGGDPLDAETTLSGDARPGAATQRPGRADAAAPAAPAAAAPAERAGRRTGAGELAALVRAWEGEPPAGASTTPRQGASTAPQEAPDLGPIALPPAATTPAAGRRGEQQAPAAAATGDPLAVGDELGRVLVAELRRYGIEVDW